MAAIEQREFRSRRGEDSFRAVFEQAAVGVAQIETKTSRFVMVNQRYCDIVGYTVEELIGLTIQDISYPDDLPANERYWSCCGRALFASLAWRSATIARMVALFGLI